MAIKVAISPVFAASAHQRAGFAGVKRKRRQHHPGQDLYAALS